MNDAPADRLSLIHVDMDAFYASCEERENPSLIGKPVIVGGDASRRGVVCSANYVARERGVHNAMPSATAVNKCPDAIFIKPRIGFYAEISAAIHEVFESFTPVVEPLALDEAFLDVSGCERLFGDAVKIAREIKDEIKRRTSLVASAGVGPNKFLAKLASGLEKPDGFVVIRPEDIHTVLDPLPVSKIWGAGAKTVQRLREMGANTVGELREMPEELLEARFGAHGTQLARLARGEDSREVISDWSRVSLGREVTFDKDLKSLDEVEAVLSALSDEVATSLRRKGMWTDVVQIKCRYADFETVTRRETLKRRTNSTDVLSESARGLLRKRIGSAGKGIRLIGVTAARLYHEPEPQLDMFADQATESLEALDRAVDRVREKMGYHAVKRASAMGDS